MARLYRRVRGDRMTSESGSGQVRTLTKDYFLELCEFSKGATQGKGHLEFLIELNYQLRHFLRLPPLILTRKLSNSDESREFFLNDILKIIGESSVDFFDGKAELNRCIGDQG